MSHLLRPEVFLRGLAESTRIQPSLLLFQVMACVYAREVTKLTYPTPSNRTNPSFAHVSLPDTFSCRSLVCLFVLLWIIIRFGSLEVSLELCLPRLGAARGDRGEVGRDGGRPKHVWRDVPGCIWWCRFALVQAPAVPLLTESLSDALGHCSSSMHGI